MVLVGVHIAKKHRNIVQLVDHDIDFSVPEGSFLMVAPDAYRPVASAPVSWRINSVSFASYGTPSPRKIS